MFVSLWNYIKGYVIVEIRGYSLERFMNLCLQAGIEIRDAKKNNDNLYIKIGIPGFKMLKPHARKSRCRLKVVKKIGLPFIRFRYRRRSVLMCGAFVFGAMIYVLSSFVWLVEVTGAKRLNPQDIISALGKAGYATGKFKRSLDLRQAENYLINQYPDIVWTGIKFEGTKMLVQIAESVPKPKIYDETIPCDIKAKRDGLITYIATEKGLPQVKAGDIVKKGDSLVLGTVQLQDETNSSYYMHAKACIKAKTAYKLTGNMSLDKLEKQYTGNIASSYSLRLFNKKIPFYKKKSEFSYSDQVVSVNQLRLTEKFPLPFYFEKHQKVEYNPIIKQYNMDEAQDELFIKLWDTLTKGLLSKESNVLDKQITYTNTENGLQAVLEVIVEENIGETVPIQITTPTQDIQ